MTLSGSALTPGELLFREFFTEEGLGWNEAAERSERSTDYAALVERFRACAPLAAARTMAELLVAFEADGREIFDNASVAELLEALEGER